MKYITVIIFLMGILLGPPALYADIYTWTDENGVKHFGNQPPDDATNARVVFKEEPHDAAADEQRTEQQNKELTEILKDLDQEEQRQATEAREKAEEAEKKRAPSKEERIAAERERLEKIIADLEEKPLDYFGSQKNKRVRIGYYRYRMEELMRDPDKYFNQPTQFEGNVKNQ